MVWSGSTGESNFEFVVVTRPLYRECKMRYGTFKRPDFVRDKNSTKYFEISFYLLDLCLVFFIHLPENV